MFSGSFEWVYWYGGFIVRSGSNMKINIYGQQRISGAGGIYRPAVLESEV